MVAANLVHIAEAMYKAGPGLARAFAKKNCLPGPSPATG